jgi:tetratricopeptide (TPR) repeat protein
LNPYVFPFDYNPQVTLPADQAFQAKTGNCLTFSSIFIAMARSAGLDAWYQEIQIPTSWSSVNETLLVSKHVNAVIQHEGRKYTVDVSLLEQDDSHRARRLSDREATAQFYNNLGADALVQNKLAQAFAYFKKALSTRPNLAYVWSNLGVVYSRNEQVQDAIAAYRHSIQLEPDQTVALNNLFLIYEEQGDLEAAAKIQSRVESNRRRNPYYLNHLAETANEEKRYADAIKLVKRAIGMDENEYRFHYTLAQSYYHLGEIETARGSLAKARELAPDDLPDGPLMLSGQE